MRSGAQIVSYELSAGLAIMTVIRTSLQIWDRWAKANGRLFKDIFAIISSSFLSLRWLLRLPGPFDLAEAESELLQAFTEYLGMKFVLSSRVHNVFCLRRWCNTVPGDGCFHSSWGLTILWLHTLVYMVLWKTSSWFCDHVSGPSRAAYRSVVEPNGNIYYDHMVNILRYIIAIKGWHF
jgi:NADH:ubiquinone oxidoreductase subunit H